ncbi:MAG: DUF4145 domain-containing protein [Chloroflexota bacterium]|nr:DUF4145 domain-containing protein [Chloroflexota bacterium]
MHLGDAERTHWSLEWFECPNPECGRFFAYLISAWIDDTMPVVERDLIWPKIPARSVPPEVPPDLAHDFREACLMLLDSPKASAALSRRCLQNLLRQAAHVKPGKLVNEIREVLDSKTLPAHLADALHAVREIGNFAAHPEKSQHTGRIIAVEPGEAEWNLDVLEGLFDFYFVQPVKMRTRKAALDQKLKEAGKNPLP